MNYSVQRTAPEVGGLPAYLLNDENGSTLLVADQSQGAPPDSRRQIRLARPSGRLVATIDLPQVAVDPGEENRRSDYAIIHEYAVYAIISVRYRSPTESNDAPGVYYLLEVEGETWLVLPHPDHKDCYAFYDEVPAGLHTYDTLTELDLPAGIGDICHDEDNGALTVSLEPRRLIHTDLIVLALAILIEQFPAAL